MAASNDIHKFRSSLNGFHRNDVINFLEQNARQQDEAQKALKTQISALQQELAQAKDTIASQQGMLDAQAVALSGQRLSQDEEKAALVARQAQLSSVNETIQAQCDTLAALRDGLMDQVTELKTQRDSALEEVATLRDAQAQHEQEVSALMRRTEQLNLENLDLTTRLAELLEPQNASCRIEAPNQELAAYRRAEAAERNAYIRARHVYRHLAMIEETLNAAVAGSDEQIAALQASITEAAAQLNDLSARLCAALRNAGAQLEAVVPAVGGSN